MLKACIIGMGNIGNTHARVYTGCDKAELAGVCDIIPERAEKAGKKYGVPFYLNAEDMLKNVKPDICSITTGGFEYSSDHYIPTIQALKAGCNVLCEKPICNDLEKAQIMVNTAKKLDRCFAINLNHRFTPAARIVKQWQNEDRLGHLLFINMALWIGRFEPLESEYYHLKALNPHSVDIMRYFCGDVDTVHCFAIKAPGRNIWSTASINMKFKNGAVGHLTSSYDIKRGHPMERCEIAGTKGRAIFEDMWREAVLYPADSLVKQVYTNPVFGSFSDFYDTFRDRIICFVDQVARGDKPEDIDGSGEQGLEASRVIHAAIESIKTGFPVKVESIRK
ncbi:MAG TPA: Gfo/Idh/MocA family oxidoreductase [Clostridiales bacterium]|nr:Gfo/Idh/MocA family oxidoreductase [Clostridiales bacterium]